MSSYNINILNHEIHTETSNFLNVLFSNSIIPLITRHTRNGEHSATLVDNILTNKKRLLDLIVSRPTCPVLFERHLGSFTCLFVTEEVVFEKMQLCIKRV